MRKRRILALAVVMVFAFEQTSYAHLIGAFSEFLAKTQDAFLLGVQNEDTTENLKREIEQTRAEIEKMTPEVVAMEQEYRQKEDVEARKLHFYSTMGFDAYAGYLMQTRDVTELLYSKQMLEDKLQRDLAALDRLYQHFRLLQTTKGSLDNYNQILELIQHHLDTRKKLFAEHPNATPQEMSKVVNDMWTKNAVFLKVQLEHDGELMNTNIEQFVTQKSALAPYRLEGYLVNQQSKLRYYFHSDHVYIHFARGDVDMILIGTWSAQGQDKIALEIEAGFINGVLIAPNLIGELKPVVIEYKNLAPKSQGFYVEQMNGYLAIQPKEKAGD